jgi:hypothetical protein
MIRNPDHEAPISCAYLVRPQFLDKLCIFSRSACHYLEPVCLGELNGVHPDTGASTVDENRLARLLLQLSHFEEGLVRGQGDNDNAGCFNRGEELRALDGFPRFYRDVLSEGTSAITNVNIRRDPTRDFFARGKS